MSHSTAYGAAEAHVHLEPMTIERRALRPDDVAIDIAYCGVCHTDAHVVNNDWGTSVFPCVPGHEIVGHVTAVGPEVERFRIGDRVAVGTMVDSCQHCVRCDNGDESSCVEGATATYNGKDRHTGENTLGGYADNIIVREKFVLRVPETLDLAQAAPLLCAGVTVWTPLQQNGIGSHSKVAVVGLGGLGHMAVKLAVALGAEVTVITTSPGKAEDAKALGATKVVISTDAATMNGAASYFDLIIDTIPTRHNVNPYLMLLGYRGTLAIIGSLDPLEPIVGALLMRNNRSITGSLMGGLPATQALLDFCAEHQVLPVCEMIDIQGINDAFQRMQENDVRYRFVIDMASLKNTIE